MKIIMTGSGTPRLRPNRASASTVVFVGEEPLLFDCGGRATIQIVKARIDLWRINYVFFTHHHFDHNVDYAQFVLGRWEEGAHRAGKLYAFGPEGTVEMTRLLFGEGGVFEKDIQARLHLPFSLHPYLERGGTVPRKPPEVEAHNAVPGLVCERAGWKVTAAVGLHAQPFLDSLVYRLDSKEGSVVITGDTTVTLPITKLAEGADLLVHSCRYPPMENVPEVHPGPGTIGQVAQEAKVKKLVLTHLVHDPTDRETTEVLRKEAKKAFDGEVYVAEDLMEIAV